MKTILIGVAFGASAVGMGGTYAAHQFHMRDVRPARAFAVAEVHPEAGKGVPAEISRHARLTISGDLHLVATYGACAVPSAVELDESSTTVRVTVWAARLPGDCVAMAQSRFVPVPLDGPLGNRTLVDSETGNRITVHDCATAVGDRDSICHL